MNRFDPAVVSLAGAVRLAVFDIDGVMTDGCIRYDDNGGESKVFHSRDGLGLKALMAYGIKLAVISARTSAAVDRRLGELGIDSIVQGRHDKARALAETLQALAVTGAQTAYVGDDLVDWPAMRNCALKCAPADGDAWLRERVDFVSSHPGGKGAVREVCELILAGHGRLSEWRESFK